MRPYVPAMALCLLLPAALPAQVIRGVVLEEGGSAAIAGVTVELLRADSTLLASAVSNPIGWFQLDTEKEGHFLLRTAHPFYTAGRIDSVTVGRHETVTIVLRMGQTPIPLAPLVVAARSRNPLQRFKVRMEEGRPTKFVTREFIERRVARPPSQLLVMTPGVRLIRSDGAIPTTAIMMRGGAGGCAANVFLDGLPVPNDPDFTIDELTAADRIEGIEIYDAYDAIPDEFPMREDMSCGVVAFWTRSEARGRFRWTQLGLFAVGAGVMYLMTR